LLVFSALPEQVKHFFLLEHIVGEEALYFGVFALEVVDVVDVVFVDGGELVHDLAQYSVFRALAGF